MNDIRNDQVTYGRQMEGAARRPQSTLRKPAKPATAPKGHEAFLKALEASQTLVEIEKASSGEKVVGRIKCSDKYTISLAVTVGDGTDRYVTRVMFKHDISEFSPIMPVSTTAPATAEVH